MTSSPKLVVMAGASLALAALILFPFFPGLMNADSFAMFAEAGTGQFDDWHTRLVPLIWRTLGANAASLRCTLILFAALFVFGTAEIFRVAGMSVIAALSTASLIAIYPPIAAGLAEHITDSWIAILFVALVAIDMNGPSRRRAKDIGRVAICTIIVLIRLDFAPFIALYIGICRFLLPGAALHKARYVAGRVAVIAGCVFLTGQIIDRSTHTFRAMPTQQIFLFDLTNISVRANELRIPKSSFPANDLQVLKKHYWPTSIGPVMYSTPPEEMLVRIASKTDFAALERAWLRAIFNHPMAYVLTKMEIGQVYLLGPGAFQEMEWYHHGIDANNLDISADHPQLLQTTLTIYDKLNRSPLLSHYLYIAVSIGTALLLIWRFRTIRGIPALAAAQLTVSAYQLALILVIGAPDFRYGFIGIPISVIGLGVTLYCWRLTNARSGRGASGEAYGR